MLIWCFIEQLFNGCKRVMEIDISEFRSDILKDLVDRVSSEIVYLFLVDKLQFRETSMRFPRVVFAASRP